MLPGLDLLQNMLPKQISARKDPICLGWIHSVTDRSSNQPAYEDPAGNLELSSSLRVSASNIKAETQTYNYRKIEIAYSEISALGLCQLTNKAHQSSKKKMALNFDSGSFCVSATIINRKIIDIYT